MVNQERVSMFQIPDILASWLMFESQYLCRLGTSPGFELAIYTLCFVAGTEKNLIHLTSSTGTYNIEIRAYHIKSKYGDKVGSAFPVVSGHLNHMSPAQCTCRPLP